MKKLEALKGAVVMTRDEIMALSGRELDAAVAEHVMGWTHLGETEGHLVGHDPQERQPNVLTVVPHYSTDIAAAWQVVEGLAEFEINDIEVTVEIRNVAEGWACWIHSGCEEIVEAREETAPLVICRAALLAMVGARRRARDRIL